MAWETYERNRRFATLPEAHGTLTGYTGLGCRCEACRKAYADYRRNYRRAHGVRERPSTKKSQLTVMLDPELARYIEEEAARTMTSKSRVVELAVVRDKRIYEEALAREFYDGPGSLQ